MQPVLYLDNAAIRRLNLHQLISEAGTVIELAARAGLTRGAIQHYKSGFRNIGDEGAHSLEDGMKKPRGWMDAAHLEDHRVRAVQKIIEQLLHLPPTKLGALSTLLDVALSEPHSE
ncbi:hypothetical protein MAFF211520_06250 [Ralstonia pseudosolanacearum]|nr:hypothetical protein MAFF211520_06250 [Ralstonia pseudosolanacearum]BEU55570.1 hypothetical protein MAFF211521_06230 [Ralstonia pseudosolanacearum]